MENPHPSGRREFLKGAAATGAAVAIANTAVPTSTASAEEKFPPVKLGIIGCGMMGTRHITRLLGMKQYCQITAVCDVYTKWLNEQADRTGAQRYKDYRKMLDSGAVDAVLVATPDHWHGKMCVDAANAGKDIYVEKPMTHWQDLQEAKDVVEAVRRNDRVMQVGVQSMSDARYEQALKMVQQGRLGKVMRAQTSYMRAGDHPKYNPNSRESEAVPGETLDWDMWLGPAPKIPFDAGRFAAFRSFFDYSGGGVTDSLPHRLAPLAAALGVGFPKRVASTGGKYLFTDRREIPDVVNISVEYPGGPSIYLMTGMGSAYNLPTQIDGSNGQMRFEGQGFEIQDRAGNTVEKVASTRAPEDPAQRVEHARNFFHSIHTREKPRCDEWFGYQVMTVLHMAIHSYLDGKVYEFDEETETVSAVG